MKKILALIFSIGCVSIAHAQVGDVIWMEEFDSLNTDQWNIITGNGCPELCFWGNFEHQYYSEDNVYTDTIPGDPTNYGLVIEAIKENFGGMQFTSGRLNTEGNIEIQYGLIEVRMMVPNLETGLWPAFWLLGANHSEVGWPQSGEIDMMEMGHQQQYREFQGHPNSTVNDFVGANLIWYANAACSDNNPTCAAAIAGDTGFNQPYQADSSLANRFVTYRLYWDQNNMSFAVVDEGVEYDLYTASVGISTGELASTFRKPFHLIVNLAVGGTFTDSPSPGDVSVPLPGKMYIDYIKVSEWNGQGTVTIDSTQVSNEELTEIPEQTKLLQNYPNPFNPTTSISFELTQSSLVELSIYDMNGRLVSELVNNTYSAGKHSVNFNASGLASGIYYYRLNAGGEVFTKKMTLIK